MNRNYRKLTSDALKLLIKNGVLSRPTQMARKEMENSRIRHIHVGTNVSRTNYMNKMQLFHEAMKRDRKLMRIMENLKTPTHATVNAYTTARNTHKKNNYNKFIKSTKSTYRLFG